MGEGGTYARASVQEFRVRSDKHIPYRDSDQMHPVGSVSAHVIVCRPQGSKHALPGDTSKCFFILHYSWHYN